MKRTSAVVFALALATAAYASVTFDPSTGNGFVSKDAVQLAFGWNDAQLEANAIGVSFSYDDAVDYDVPCKKDAAKIVLRHRFGRSAGLVATVQSDGRVGPSVQVTGFNLYRFRVPILSGSVECPAGWEADGDPVDVGSSGGGLHVRYGGAAVALR
jgi:hypothetical protein